MIVKEPGKLNNIFLNSSYFYSVILFSISLNLASPILIEISNYIGKNIEYMGTIFSFSSFGYIFGAFLNNIFLRYFSKKKITLFFYFLLAISVFFVTLSTNFYFLTVCFFFIGLCAGLIEMQVSVLVMDLNIKREGLFISLIHVFFGIGAFIGPFLSSLIISKGFSWKYPFYLVAILCFLNFLLFIFLKIPDTKIYKESYRFRLTKQRIFNKNIIIFLLLVFIMLFYISAEVGFTSWLPTFLRLNRDFSNIFAGRALSFFWIALMSGRLIVGFLTRRIKMFYILIILTFLSIFPAALSIYLNSTLGIMVSVILTGFFLSGVVPLAITLGGIKYADKRNFVISQLIIFGGIGGLVSPWLIGKLYQQYNLFFSLNLIFIFLILVFLLTVAAYLFDERAQVPNGKA
jgi:fucose permease